MPFVTVKANLQGPSIALVATKAVNVMFEWSYSGDYEDWF